MSQEKYFPTDKVSTTLCCLYDVDYICKVDPESFVRKPLIFGNFIRLEVPIVNRVYENYTNRYT